MRPATLILSTLMLLAACETSYPNGPPLRGVETEEDREFIGCLARDPLLAGPECHRFRRNDR